MIKLESVENYCIKVTYGTKDLILRYTITEKIWQRNIQQYLCLTWIMKPLMKMHVCLFCLILLKAVLSPIYINGRNLKIWSTLLTSL